MEYLHFFVIMIQPIQLITILSAKVIVMRIIDGIILDKEKETEVYFTDVDSEWCKWSDTLD